MSAAGARWARAGRWAVWALAAAAFFHGVLRALALALQISLVSGAAWEADARGVLEMDDAAIAAHRSASVEECAVQLVAVLAGTVLVPLALLCRVPGALLRVVRSARGLRSLPGDVQEACALGLWSLLLACAYALLGGMAGRDGWGALAARTMVVVTSPMLYLLVCALAAVPEKGKKDACVIEEEQAGQAVHPAEQTDTNVPPEEQTAKSVPSAEHVAKSVPPEEQTAKSVQPTEQADKSVQPEQQKDHRVQPKEQTEYKAQPRQRPIGVPLCAAVLCAMMLAALSLAGAELGGFRVRSDRTLVMDALRAEAKAPFFAFLQRADPPAEPSDVLLASCDEHTSHVGTLLFSTVLVNPADLGAAAGESVACRSADDKRSLESLLAIVGHELGHVAERMEVPRALMHVLRSFLYCVVPAALASSQMATSGLSSGLGDMHSASAVFGALSFLVPVERALADAGVSLRLLYGRSREYAADRYSVEALGAAPSALVAALRPYAAAPNCAAAARLYEALFLTHPAMDRRLRAARAYVQAAY